MPELVALDLPAGRGFVDAIQAVWDTGDAVAPLDPRLPGPARQAMIDALGPTRIVGADGGIGTRPDGRPVEDGVALVMATSGSSGQPKGVALTHGALAASARATSARLGIDPARHSWLACLPLAHIGGLAVVLRALLTGTRFTVLPGFEPEEVQRLGRAGSATHISLVATALGRIDASVFESILLGGAAPPGEVAPNVVTTYGMTETGSGIVYDGIPLDGVSVAIGDGGAGGGAQGEILVSGPMLFDSYRDGSDGRVTGPDGAGAWFATGDGGHITDRGTLAVDGRMAEVIVTGGEKVWPVAVEHALAGVRGVAEVAVWKRSDPEWGERVVAWVVSADPGAPPSLGDLRDRVSGLLAPWAAPKELVLVSELPRTSSGKLRRPALH